MTVRKRPLRSPEKPRIRHELGHDSLWTVTCYLCAARRVTEHAVMWAARNLRTAARLAGEHHDEYHHPGPVESP